MKLLGWMHRKLRPNNGGDGFKDFGGGAGACICIGGRTSPDEDLHRRRRRQYEPFHARARGLGLDAEELFEGGGGRGDPAVEEIFEGFLAIGTLGVGPWPNEEEDEASIEDAQKESVAGEELVVVRAALETIAEKEAEATTETDLMVVETELEKVLASEAEREGGRRSSAARSSHAGSSGAAAAACPLQGFLFGSSSEVAGAIEAEVADAGVAASSRKERRPSLAELFIMSRIAEEAAGRAKAAGVGNAADWEEKATTEMRLLNKRMAKRGGWKGSDGADAADVSTAETKIQKILQMFHRKVHPQNSTSTRRSCKTGKIEKKHYVPLIGGNAMKVKDERRKEIINNLNSSDMNVDQGHWIKTDANCEYICGAGAVEGEESMNSL